MITSSKKFNYIISKIEKNISNVAKMRHFGRQTVTQVELLGVGQKEDKEPQHDIGLKRKLDSVTKSKKALSIYNCAKQVYFLSNP